MKIIKKFLKSTLIFSLSLGLLLSNWPHQINIAYAVNQKIRQEINIVNGYVGSASGAYATSSEMVRIDTTAYTSPTYYFEVVASTTSVVSSSIYLKNATTSATVATVTFSNSNTYGIYRSASFTPTSGQHDYVVVTGNSAVQKGVIAARVVILQDATALAATETHIEIGNRELAKNNTSTSALTNPKYWYYDSTKWSDSPVFYVEATYKDIQVASSTIFKTATTSDSNYTATTVNGISYLTVEAWGAGGGGSIANAGGGGGGGGAYAKSIFATTSGNINRLFIPKGGLTNTNASAGDATFNDTAAGTISTEVIADGGTGTSGNTAGTGGTVANSTGQVEFAGGNGGVGNTTGDVGGGGGGAGGPDGAGVAAVTAGANAPSAGGNGDNGSGGAGGAAGSTNTDVCSTSAGKAGINNDKGGGGGGGAGSDSTGACSGGPGAYPGGGGGSSEFASASQPGGPGQIKLTETHGKVSIALEEDNGSFGSWTFKTQIVTLSDATTTPTRTRVSFTPTTGRNYRIVASTTDSTASYDIYNAKIIAVQKSSISQVGSTFSLVSDKPALAGMSSTRVAFLDGLSDLLKVYDFDGSTWSQIGNSLSLVTENPQRPTLTALSSTRVVAFNYASNTLRGYDFDGTNWTSVLNDFTITGAGYGAITALSSTQIAFIDDTLESLRTYSLSGSNWSLTGSGLSIPGLGTPSLATLSSTRVALVDSNLDLLTAYDFNGSTWSQVGNSLAISGVGSVSITSLSSTRITFQDESNHEIRVYDFDGTNWSQVGATYLFPAAGLYDSAQVALSSTRIAYIDSGSLDGIATYDISTVSSSGITYLEPQYLLANTLFGSGTSLQNFLTSWDPAEWTTGNTYAFIHEGNSVSGGTSDIKIQNTSGPTDISGSTITDVIEREQSSSMTMPGSAVTLDVVATSNGSNLYGSRILVQVSPTATVPDAPTTLDAVAGYGRVNLTWVTPASNGGSAITGYKLYRDTTTSPTTLIATLGVVTSYWDGAITNGTLYYYRVKATNAIGDSAYSNEDSATPTEAPASSSRSGIKFIGPSLKFLGGRILFR